MPVTEGDPHPGKNLPPKQAYDLRADHHAARRCSRSPFPTCMIQLHNIHLAFGGKPILDGLTWTIKPDRRIGLIGPNGAGKSTLLRVIAGEHTPDDGTVSMSGGTTIGYLAQDTQEAASEKSVLEEGMKAFAETLALQDEEHRIAEALDAEDDHTSDAYQRLLHDQADVHTRLTASEAHLIQPKTEAVLTGLGFDPDELSRPLSTFSGGWRMRVALARILLREPAFLLLDEPTNHLDIDSIAWFEGYLKAYPGTVIMVSHDRYFLDRMVTTTAELSNGQITEYAGNYAFYLEERGERRLLQRAAYENQQREIAETERFIERFRYKASKAKQVQSRVKQLERLERIPPPPDEQAEISFRFPEPPRSGRIVMEFSEFSKTYTAPEGDVHVFTNAGPITIERGDKIALIGKNGAGKSTLARMLRGTEPFDGTRKLGYNVEMTFFAQHQAETLDHDRTVLESLRETAVGKTETELRTLLGTFLFQGDDVFKPVRVLSGGEKSRLSLARTLMHPANFLILDEPTNHLDIQSIGVLVEALKQYTGSFVIVSHDRHFLDQVVTHVWRAEGGQVLTFEGTYSDYEWHREHGTAARFATHEHSSTPALQPEPTPVRKTKEQKREEAEARNRRHQQEKQGKYDFASLNPFKLRKTYQNVEADILRQEERKANLEADLADPNLYTDPDRAQQKTADYEAVKADLATLYEKWEALAEHLAALDEA